MQAASDRLVPWGYVALLVDSFTTRNIDHACTAEKYAAEETNILKRTFDAYDALLFLARQPFVDPRRVAVVGVSQGGLVTLSVAEERTFELFINPSNLAFRAAVALSSVFCSRCPTWPTDAHSCGRTRRLDTG